MILLAVDTWTCQEEVQDGCRPSYIPAFISSYRCLPYIEQIKMSLFTELSYYTMALS